MDQIEEGNRKLIYMRTARMQSEQIICDQNIWKVGEGLKHDAILSPTLFIIVMDEVMKTLKVNLRRINVG